MQSTAQIQPANNSTSSKTCLGTGVSIILGLWGALIGIGVLWFTVVFIQAQMMNVINILYLAIAAVTSAVLVFSAFKVGKIKWYITLFIVLLVVMVNSIFNGALINYSTARLRMESISMAPTLAPKDYFIVDKLAFHSKTPQRGDIVFFTSSLGQKMIKRVIGLPGETVTIQSGQVYIDGALLNEPDGITSSNQPGQWQVGEHEYFVLGDNRNNSADSRTFGNVPVENILGKITYIYLPISRAGKIPNAYSAP